MRLTNILASLLAAAAIAACANQMATQPAGTGASAPAPAMTTDQKILIGKQTVTSLRKDATQLLVAKKITVPQDQKYQADLDAAYMLLVTAQEKNLTDPAAALAMLSQALQSLADIQASQGASK